MIGGFIRASFARPLVPVLLLLAGTVLGGVWMRDLPRDVFPDVSVPIFNVIVQNATMGTEELEQAVAIPLETALSGLPEVRRVRSTTTQGVAQVTVEFEPDAAYATSPIYLELLAFVQDALA